MQHLPLFADLKDKDCLVVGGGAVAARRTLLLLEAGAKVHVVAPTLLWETVSELATDGRIEHDARAYRGGPLDRYWLIVAATNDRAINARVAADAHAARTLCNVVDDPEL